MSQNTNYNLANQSGANFRAELNNTLLDIVSNNSGATEPATMFAYELMGRYKQLSNEDPQQR